MMYGEAMSGLVFVGVLWQIVQFAAFFIILYFVIKAAVRNGIKESNKPKIEAADIKTNDTSEPD